MKEALKKIKLVDIFIIVVLIILLINASFSIFMVEEPTKQIASKLDLAFRTTLSSIIGYILSSNFISNKIKMKTKCALVVEKSEEQKKEQNIQLIIIGTVAVICLIVLLIARHFYVDADLNRINIVLMTDICVGCIGFLIGYTD